MGAAVVSHSVNVLVDAATSGRGATAPPEPPKVSGGTAASLERSIHVLLAAAAPPTGLLPW
eukprot:3048491-Pyramimonas_sp.AAC.1